MPNPYPKITKDETSGLEFPNKKHPAFEAGVDNLVQAFNKWADELLAIYMNMPLLSPEYKIRLKAKIDILQFAKVNLARLAKELK